MLENNQRRRRNGGNVQSWTYRRARPIQAQYGHIREWDASSVTDMESMFGDARAFNQPVGDWDMSKLTNMSCMFIGAQSFNQDLSRWDLRSMTNSLYMFEYASAMQRVNRSLRLRKVREGGGEGSLSLPPLLAARLVLGLV